MTSEKLLQEIKEMRELNRSARERNNQLLSHLEGYINKKKSEDYQKGLDDVWTVMARIFRNDTCENNITDDELIDMFPECVCDWNNILREYSPKQVIEIVAEYDKKKAEEKAKAEEDSKLVMGDIVEVYCVEDNSFLDKGIYLDTARHDYVLIFDDCDCPQLMNADSFKLVKTGERADLKDLVKKSKEE